MHPPGPYFPAKSMEAAYCGRFRALGTKRNGKKDGARRTIECVAFFYLEGAKGDDLM